MRSPWTADLGSTDQSNLDTAMMKNLTGSRSSDPTNSVNVHVIGDRAVWGRNLEFSLIGKCAVSIFYGFFGMFHASLGKDYLIMMDKGCIKGWGFPVHGYSIIADCFSKCCWLIWGYKGLLETDVVPPCRSPLFL